ncbi:ehs-1 [Pristionchus pacificus]|uniref:Ehs-1 n=1 Tax=Pristionchus pacificus TaxID=54126 RepID=A0A2A6BZ40_PRIPA|nr:ehs-1 [Pristionchus pacificus]|eukprot:PDM71160.1 ehs-1 [Pristionchus pacificus]
MADLNQLVNPHGPFYESVYQRLDPSGTGIVTSGPVAELLKTSGLPTQLLGLIWEEADYAKRGYLDRRGVYIALKLVAAVQSGHSPSSASLGLPLGPPSLGGISPMPPSAISPGGGAVAQWGISPTDQAKYDAIFDSLQPENGKLPGGKVRPVLLNSGLNPNMLAKIWELADQDKDGFLDRVEMNVALHLVYRALQGEGVPRSLPDHLIHPTKSMLSRRNSIASASGNLRSRTGSVTSLNEMSLYTPTHAAAAAPNRPYSVQAPRPPSLTPQHTGQRSGHSEGGDGEWPVRVTDYADHFALLDTDRDGLVNGLDCRGFLMNTNLPQHMLAHAWSALVDMNQSGMLSLEQFSLLLYLIHRLSSLGEDLPRSLPSHLIPPSMRTPTTNGVPQPPSLPGSQPTSPLEDDEEAMTLVADINRMEDERRKAEEEMGQIEMEMKRKQNEMKQLSVELKTLESTVKQLEKQKAEANRRLGEMDDQKNRLIAAAETSRGKSAETTKRMENLMEETHRATENKEEDDAKMFALRQEVSGLEGEAASAEADLRSELHSLEGTVGELSRLEREATSLEREKEKTVKVNATIDEALRELEGAMEKGEQCSMLFDDFSRFSLADTPSTSYMNNSVYAGKTVPPDPFGNSVPAQSFSAFGSGGGGGKAPPPRPAPPGGVGKRATPVHDPFANADPFSGNEPSFGGGGSTTSSAFADFANFGQFS